MLAPSALSNHLPGANQGLGFQTSLELARRGYRVLGMDVVPEALRQARDRAAGLDAWNF